MQTETLQRPQHREPTGQSLANPSQLGSMLYQVFDSQARATLDWQPFGADGRRNVMIQRLYDCRQNGAGPAAALLKYAPGAAVPTHLHAGYELILVLEGELINDAGRHGPGTLEICPPGSTHALASEQGCTFLVVWEQPVVKLS